MKIINISIIDPATGRPVSVKEWEKVEDPTIAEWILIRTDELRPFKVRKDPLNDGDLYAWAEAARTGSAPTRAQAMAIHDAHFQGLNAAIDLIRGTRPDELTWTIEESADPGFAAEAWVVALNSGNVLYDPKARFFRVRPVSAFDSSLL